MQNLIPLAITIFVGLAMWLSYFFAMLTIKEVKKSSSFFICLCVVSVLPFFLSMIFMFVLSNEPQNCKNICALGLISTWAFSISLAITQIYAIPFCIFSILYLFFYKKSI